MLCTHHFHSYSSESNDAEAEADMMDRDMMDPTQYCRRQIIHYFVTDYFLNTCAN